MLKNEFIFGRNSYSLIFRVDSRFGNKYMVDINEATNVSDAVYSRITVRAYLDKAVDPTLLRTLFDKARRAPSGGNLQPWRAHVMTGEILNAFRDEAYEKTINSVDEGATHPAYPKPLWEPQRSWRYKVGEDMYGLLGIARDNKPGRLKWVADNSRFFDAPVGVVITGNKALGMPQHMDIGIYLQTLMLLAREVGLHTTPQGWWRGWSKTCLLYTSDAADD